MRRALKILKVGTIAIALGCAALYFALFAMQAYSSRQASQILDRVEAIRLGDSYSDFERAVQGCPVEATAAGSVCRLSAGAYRLGSFWNLVWKLPERWSYWIQGLADRSGLRYWQLTVSASAEDGRIRNVSAGIFLAGRYEALGSAWELAGNVPSRYERWLRTSADQRTYMSWYHITSRPSGEGFRIDATPASTDKELHARRVNRKCFSSFRGCDGLCELLPDAVPVLNERNTDWGGCTSVPRSSCELKNDNCRTVLDQAGR